MTNYILTKVATFQSVFSSNSGAIFNDIDANPGATRAGIQTRTGKIAAIVNTVIQVALEARLIVQGYDVAGLEYFWASADWQTLLLNNIAAARTWLTNNDNGLVSAMAISLGIHEAVAIDLARILQAEASLKMTAQ